jgi:hypothetical protein
MSYLTAGTYVQINRDDLEAWLDTLSLSHKWSLRPGAAGIYLLPVSENVGVKLSSTIGSKDDAMGRGMGSMQLALVSLVTGQVLNKKAQGQAHFARTSGWKKNWKEGFERMKEAYQKAQGFYDALALIEDREKYKREMLTRIEAISGWQQHHLLSDFYNRIQAGGILTTAQVEVIIKAEKAPPKVMVPDQKELLERMRTLWSAATRAGDRWLVEFLNSVGPQVKGGRALTEKQQVVLDKNFQRYRI